MYDKNLEIQKSPPPYNNDPESSYYISKYATIAGTSSVFIVNLLQVRALRCQISVPLAY